MSKPKHTPGPWLAIGSSIVRSNNLTVADCRNLYDVHQFTSVDGSRRKEMFEEQGANARLIAAAPEMLEALQDVLKAFRVCIGNEAFQAFVEGNNAVIAAHQAIAKAMGGE